MWARDCNVICAPVPSDQSGDSTTAHRAAHAVAAATGVGMLFYPGSQCDLSLDIEPEVPAKKAALAAHGLQALDAGRYEAFMSPAAQRL
jgi:LmbE family N-acetylglucosaminyl deacetylase